MINLSIQNLKIFSSNLNTSRDMKTRAGIIDVLKGFKPDIWLMQEVNVSTDELKSLICDLGYDACCNVDCDGETSRGTAFVWKQNISLENIYTIEECRVQSAQIGRLNLLNIYAPSGSENKYARRELFNQTVMRFFRSTGTNLPLVGGDFNCVLGRLDARYNADKKGCPGLQSLINCFNLSDIFRYLYPNTVEYTFHRADSASRLDRFYSPQFMLPHLVSVQHIPQSFSDHCIVETVLSVPDLQRIEIPRRISRKSFWKMNIGTIDEDFRDNFCIIYNKAREHIDEYADIADWWDYKCKPLVIHFCKMYSISQARERKCTKNFLYIQLKEALENAPFNEILRIKEELNRILLFEANGIKVRSRHKEDLEIEKASLFHMNREMKKGQANNAECLMIGPKDNMHLEKDPDKCKEEVIKFFTALFSGKLGLDGEVKENGFVKSDEYIAEFLNDDLKKLNDDEQIALECTITSEELLQTVKNLPKHKSPGIDGLPFELYQAVFPVIGDDYLDVQNCIWKRERLTDSMRCSVTRLPPKIPTGVPTVLQLRPISMQVADYGIRNRIVAQRMTKVIPSILTSGQLCNHKEKNILFGITNMISSVEYARKKRLPAAIASYDMDHAFDRAYIPYIVEVLKFMNFGDKFIRIIIDSHSDITTRLILNGLTEPVKLLFSFRQGDPISMLLYLIYIEPLLVKLGKSLHGIKFPDFTEIDDDYCDDIEIMIENDQDLIIADEIFRMFESFAGAVLNRSHKSRIMGLGCNEGRQDWPLAWLKVEESLKIFGIIIYPNYLKTVEENWKILLKKFRDKLFSWNLRSLDTFQQRVDVVRMFGTSKLWYVCQVLPMPSKYAKQIENLIWKFVWVGKLEKLSLDETKNSRNMGGLDILCIRSKSDALFLRQTCRMLAEPDLNSYRHIQYWVGQYLQNYLPDLGAGAHDDVVPPYFEHLKRLFEEAHASVVIDIDNLNGVTAKHIYEDFTSTFPPPKIIYKYEGLPWEDIWRRLNRPVINSQVRDVMFLIIHDVLPTKQRLFRMNKCRSEDCDQGDGLEDVVHLFTGCRRVQVAWAWCRRKIMNLITQPNYPSDFELLNLAYVSDMDDEIIWLVSNFCYYVYDQRRKKAHNYVINVDKLKENLSALYIVNQNGQNAIRNVLF